MDPNACLNEIRSLANIVSNGAGTRNDALGLVDRFMDLDEWITKGGFLPSDWAK